MTSQLCRKCRRIFDNWDNILREFDQKDFVSSSHWENIEQFKKSADHCHLCAQFLYQFSGEELVDAARNHDDIMSRPEIVVTPFVSNGRIHEDSWRLSLYLPLKEGPLIAEVSMGQAQNSSITDPLSFLSIQPSTACDTTILQAQKWIRDCSQTHKICAIPDKYALPTRLLAFGDDRLHLILSNDMLDRPEYVTLSHCWGTLDILKLTTSNLSSLLNEIPYDQLCKTFRDAIFIAKKLHFGYLWIDSLCIIQDDEDDWRRESTLMSSVYGGSSLNIAAASTNDGSVGCFFDRSVRAVQRLRIAIEVQGQERIYDCADANIYQRCVSQTLLARRAWVLQERVLAPRTLHFSATQLLWECESTFSCETFPMGLPVHFYWGLDGLRKEKPSEMWASLVYLYTQCNLTYTKDRLVAISSIARWVQTQNGDEWLAGLWKRDLIIEISWGVCGQLRTGVSRPLPYQAPSWSWASVEGGQIIVPRRSPHIEYGFCARLMDYEIKTPGPDSFGEVQSGVLYLTCGSLLRGILKTHRNPSLPQPTILIGDVNFSIVNLDVHREAGTLVYLLSLYFDLDSLNGIIIEPTKLKPGQFQRIGKFIITNRDRHEFVKAMKSPSCVADVSLYSGVVEVTEYAEDLNLGTLIVDDNGEKLYLFTDKQYVITLV